MIEKNVFQKYPWEIYDDFFSVARWEKADEWYIANEQWILILCLASSVPRIEPRKKGAVVKKNKRAGIKFTFCNHNQICEPQKKFSRSTNKLQSLLPKPSVVFDNLVAGRFVPSIILKHTTSKKTKGTNLSATGKRWLHHPVRFFGFSIA